MPSRPTRGLRASRGRGRERACRLAPVVFLNPVPGDPFVVPADTHEPPMFRIVAGVVMVAVERIGIVFAVERRCLRVVGIPANTLIYPTCRNEAIAFVGVYRVMMLAAIGIVKSVHRS